MADIRPFRAFFYGPRRRSALGRLVCPPYDVISAEQQKKLLARHPDNFVRVELPRGKSPAKYGGAARLWKKWLAGGVIERDAAPAFYVYEASFKSQLTGRPLSRLGFFAALRLRPWGEGIHPHEKTLPTPKADRLRLFKAMRAQTSPIQCLFDDHSGRPRRILRRAAAGEPWIDLSDEAGVRHRLWRLPDGPAAAELRRILRRSAVVIADGHHRYETSRAYSAWARKKWGVRSEASNHVMAFFSPSDDPALEILPTHRAVGFDKRRFVRLEKWGRLGPATKLKALMAGLRRPTMDVGVYRGGTFHRYRFSSLPPAVKRTPFEKLSVACLHAGPLEGLGKEDFFFTRRPEEAVKFARATKGWAFFLGLNTVDEVVRVAASGRVMPPKSTYFYPKMPSGFLSHSLHGNL